MTTQTRNVNGVNVERLKETVKTIQEQPALGKFQFRAHNQWLDAAHNRSTIQGFYGAGQEDDTRQKPYIFECDEPPVLLGQDQGANPVEHLLNALAGCITTSMVMHAASRGIKIDSVESELEGDIDVRGFLGLTNEVPRGYQGIQVKFRIKSDADMDVLRQLAEYSPVYNSLVNPTPVSIAIEKV